MCAGVCVAAGRVVRGVQGAAWNLMVGGGTVAALRTVWLAAHVCNWALGLTPHVARAAVRVPVYLCVCACVCVPVCMCVCVLAAQVTMCLWDAMYTYVLLAHAALFADVETSNAGRTRMIAIMQVAELVGAIGPFIGYVHAYKACMCHPNQCNARRTAAASAACE